MRIFYYIWENLSIPKLEFYEKINNFGKYCRLVRRMSRYIFSVMLI